MQMESATGSLNVPTNVPDVPTDLVRTKSGGQLSPLGYANGGTYPRSRTVIKPSQCKMVRIA